MTGVANNTYDFSGGFPNQQQQPGGNDLIDQLEQIQQFMAQ